MFFLIRCVFWLSIVFSSMTWAVGASQPKPQAFRDAVVSGGLAAVGAATAVVEDEAKAWCVKSPGQCLDDAARLTALVSANQNEDTGEASRIEPARPSDRRDPVPPSRPQHRVPPKS